VPEGWSLVVIAGLGAYHGLNPAMGWLFAVGLGLQERSRSAVLRALGPIAIGHELAVALVAAIVLVAGGLVDGGPLRLVAAAALIAFGLFRFVKPRAHPRWTRMRVRGRELTLWSFLMSSAHGAGLMVTPVLLGAGTQAGAAGEGGPDHAVDAVQAGVLSVPQAAVALALHVGAMLLVMGVVAVVVYDRFGLAVLRRAWVNTDALWAGAFVVAGVVTLLT
jgi:hypothetical protein